MPWIESLTPPTVTNTSTGSQVTGNPFSYYAYDLLTGRLIGTPPFRGAQFGQQLNTPGQGSFTLDLYDPRVQSTNPINCTVPNRTLIVVDYGGAIIWAGIVMTRRWQVNGSPTNTQGTLGVQCAELWTYFQQRVQATDYSAPPTSGITSPMTYWTQTPWDAGLIATQVIADAIGYSNSATTPYGNPLGGTVIKYNGASPSAARPQAPGGDWVAVTYPITSTQTVDTIVTQLSQLGYGVGFDFGVDVAYSAGPGSTPTATVNLSYPRRGRTVTQNNLVCDLTTARGYEFPEDGTQTANQMWEIGGSGALNVSVNVNPLNQGYPLWERVMSRANAQSQNIINLLTQTGFADLTLYSYPPMAPTITLGYNDPNLPLGSYIVGDDVQVMIPATAPDGNSFDPRFPAGMSQEWRIVSWQTTVADEGDAVTQFTLNQPPPSVLPIAPAAS